MITEALRILLDHVLSTPLAAVDLAAEHLPPPRPGSTAALPTQRVRAAIEAWLSTRGALPRRHDVPWWFWPLVTLHGSMGLVMLLYPFLLGRAHDGWFLTALLAVMLSWAVFAGECILSVLEKKAFYTHYTLGLLPLHQWYMDVFTPAQSLAIITCVALTWSVALLTVLCRNWDARARLWSLSFSGAGVELVAGLRARS